MVAVAGLRGINVEIYSSDTSLPEHNHPQLKNRDYTTSRYVECEPGKEFTIIVDCDKGVKFLGEALCIRIYIDGEYCDSRVYSRGHMKDGVAVMHSDGRRTSETSCLPYVFAGAQVDEYRTRPTANLHHDFKPSNEPQDQLGCIRVEITGVNRGKAIKESFQMLKTAAKLRTQALKDRSLSCLIGFGLRRQHVRLGRPIDVKPTGVLHIVQMYYRTRGDLRNIGIDLSEADDQPTFPIRDDEHSPEEVGARPVTNPQKRQKRSKGPTKSRRKRGGKAKKHRRRGKRFHHGGKFPAKRIHDLARAEALRLIASGHVRSTEG